MAHDSNPHVREALNEVLRLVLLPPLDESPGSFVHKKEGLGV